MKLNLKIFTNNDTFGIIKMNKTIIDFNNFIKYFYFIIY